MGWLVSPDAFVDILQNMKILKTRRGLKIYRLKHSCVPCKRLLHFTKEFIEVSVLWWIPSIIVCQKLITMYLLPLDKRKQNNYFFIAVFIYFLLQVNRPSPRITQVHNDANKEEGTRLFPGQRAWVSKFLSSFSFLEKSHSRALAQTSHHSYKPAGWYQEDGEIQWVKVIQCIKFDSKELKDIGFGLLLLFCLFVCFCMGHIPL